MRIVFMGTPDFAAASLQKLLDEKFNVVGVFTQPDKPKGRGMEMCFSPVKELALAHGLPVYQPEKMRDGIAYEQIKALAPDILVVVAYGRILPDNILALPKYGAVNVHGSRRGTGGHIPGADAGEPGNKKVLGADEDVDRPGVQLRAVLLQPHQLGQGQGAVAAVPGGVQEVVAAHGFFQRGGLGLCPAIGVEDGGADRVQILIQRDQILHLPAHDNALNVLRGDISGELPGNFAESRPPVLGCLLLKPVMAESGQFHGAGENGLPRFIDQCALDGGGSRVKCGDVCHMVSLLTPRRRDRLSGR